MPIAEKLILRRFGQMFFPILACLLILCAGTEHSISEALTWVVALGALPAALPSGVLFAELVSTNELLVIESSGVAASKILLLLSTVISGCYATMLFLAFIFDRVPARGV